LANNLHWVLKNPICATTRKNQLIHTDLCYETTNLPGFPATECDAKLSNLLTSVFHATKTDHFLEHDEIEGNSRIWRVASTLQLTISHSQRLNNGKPLGTDCCDQSQRRQTGRSRMWHTHNMTLLVIKLIDNRIFSSICTNNSTRVSHKVLSRQGKQFWVVQLWSQNITI